MTLTGTTSDEIWPQLEHVLHASFTGLKERPEERRRTSLSEAVLARVDEAERRGVGVGGGVGELVVGV